MIITTDSNSKLQNKSNSIKSESPNNIEEFNNNKYSINLNSIDMLCFRNKVFSDLAKNIQDNVDNEFYKINT